jgi:hypothetical protein
MADSARASFLIQLLLPTRANDRQPIGPEQFASVRATLTDQFGGVTAYLRAPAKGLWKRPDGEVDDDDVVMIEVQADSFDRDWWHAYQRRLEHDFRQDTVLIRVIPLQTL